MCVSRGGWGVKMHIPFNDIVSVVMREGGEGGGEADSWTNWKNI